MEIVFKTSDKKKRCIKRDSRNEGMVRLDQEACDALQGILDNLTSDRSVKEIASTLIKAAADHAIIREEDEE